jgi:hypothetical protein
MAAKGKGHVMCEITNTAYMEIKGINKVCNGEKGGGCKK